MARMLVQFVCVSSIPGLNMCRTVVETLAYSEYSHWTEQEMHACWCTQLKKIVSTKSTNILFPSQNYVP
jgi:hypothetical protein